MGVLIVLIATILCMILYRAGGQGKGVDDKPKWMPMWLRESWVRDWLIPGVCLLALTNSIHFNLICWVIFYGLTGGALTLYWDDSKNKILGWICSKINWMYPKDNYWLSGFIVGIATLPLIFCGMLWYMVLVRAILLAVLWGGWCAIFSKDTTEEYGRGAFIALTLPLLLI